MFTLTLDPQLHESPEAAWEYCQKNRAVAETMRRLELWGYIQPIDGKREWFAVLEWHKSGWAHWHVLVPTKPSGDLFAALKRAWNMNWPGWEERVAIGRPGFGAVKFRTQSSITAAHAANYACKYVIKYPEEGFHDWVIDKNRKSVHRFTASRGFWGYQARTESEEDQPAESVDMMGETVAPGILDAQAVAVAEKRTIRQVMESCGKSSNLFEVVEILNTQTGEIRTVRVYKGTVHAPMFDIRETIVAEEYPKNGKSLLFDLNGAGWAELVRQAKAQPPAPAEVISDCPSDDIPF
jgi:hypothetical protein